MFLAFTSESEFRFLQEADQAPPESIVFADPSALAHSLSVQQMDRIRANLLKRQVPGSRSKKTAAIKLWNLLILLLHAKPPAPRKVRRDPLIIIQHPPETTKYVKSDMVVLDYVRGRDRMRDLLYGRLPLRARGVIEILAQDGRGSWTHDEIEALMIGKMTSNNWTKDNFSAYRQHRHALNRAGMIRFVPADKASRA